MFFSIHLMEPDLQDPLKPAGWYLKGGYGNAQHVGHDEFLQEELVVHMKPMLAHQTVAEPAATTGNDGDAVSFLHGYLCTGMFSQEERLTHEVQQSTVKCSRNNGRSDCECGRWKI
jgi:hypothetical protein